MESCIEYSKSKGGEVCLPWIIVADKVAGDASKHMQFGVFWNSGAYGSAAFGVGKQSVHTWTGYNLDQVDFLVTTYNNSVDASVVTLLGNQS